MLTKYVLGFYFITGTPQVLMIERTDHTWQHGLINGIGGKIKDGEYSIEAMEREFKEETGLIIPGAMWNKVMEIGTKEKWNMSIYWFEGKKLPPIMINDEGNLLFLDMSHRLPDNTEPTARWAALMCFDLRNEKFNKILIQGSEYE